MSIYKIPYVLFSVFNNFCDYIKNKINNYISFLEKELSNETDTRIKAKLLWSINYCKERLKELMNN